MKTLQFKTNINCSGCVARVTPRLNGEKNIQNWKVDTDNPDKILTVVTEELGPEDITGLLKKIGFQAESV